MIRWLLLLGTALLSLPVAAQTLPSVGSGTLVLHLKADASSVAADAMGDVQSWTAENDPSIVLATDPGTNPGDIRFDATGMNGNPTVVVTDTGNPFLSTTLPASVDLSDVTVFWLGRYSASIGGGQYLYTIGTSAGSGATELSHQQDGGRVEIYNGDTTFAGDTIAPFRNIYTVWTTQYFSGTPVESHVAYADGVDLGVGSNSVGYDVAPDPHPISLFAFQQGGFNFEGELAELLIYDGILTPTDLEAVEDYLRDRSGEPPAIDLSTGTVVQFAPGGSGGCQPDATWVLGPTGTTLGQLTNSDPSIYLTAEESSGQTIRGRLAAGNAPDFMGFVFGYQDPGHFYLFDWKKSAASWCGGTADEGMRLRVVDVQGGSEPGVDELWGVPASANITELRENDVPWATDVDYEFDLTFDAGQIDLEVRDGTTVLESWSVADTTYSDGLFGLYVDSLENAAFGPFHPLPEPGTNTLLVSGAVLVGWLKRRRAGRTRSRAPRWTH